MTDRPIVRKEYYSIGEVCDLLDLKPHVLRYWESQFPLLNPSKNRSGNRVYQRKEIKLISAVKQLLYEEKYTIEGAKQKLSAVRRDGDVEETGARAFSEDAMESARSDLAEALELLSPKDED